jgi:hypothetical protein
MTGVKNMETPIHCAALDVVAACTGGCAPPQDFKEK